MGKSSRQKQREKRREQRQTTGVAEEEGGSEVGASQIVEEEDGEVCEEEESMSSGGTGGKSVNHSLIESTQAQSQQQVDEEVKEDSRQLAKVQLEEIIVDKHSQIGGGGAVSSIAPTTDLNDSMYFSAMESSQLDKSLKSAEHLPQFINEAQVPEIVVGHSQQNSSAKLLHQDTQDVNEAEEAIEHKHELVRTYGTIIVKSSQTEDSEPMPVEERKQRPIEDHIDQRELQELQEAQARFMRQKFQLQEEEEEQQLEERRRKIKESEKLAHPPSHFVRAEQSPIPPDVRGYRQPIEEQDFLSYKTERQKRKLEEEGNEEKPNNFVKYALGAVAAGAIIYAGARFLMRNKKR